MSTDKPKSTTRRFTEEKRRDSFIRRLLYNPCAPSDFEGMAFDPRFEPNSSIVLSGSSGTGKTSLVTTWIKDQKKYFKNPFDLIFCSYRVYQKAYWEWPAYCSSCLFFNGIPTLEHLEKCGVLDADRHSLFICDDWDDCPEAFPLLVKLFTTYCHHKNVTAVALFHHIFSPVKSSVLLFRNCRYTILFGSARDKSSIKTLGAQSNPENPKFLLAAYESATRDRPFGFLCCDYRPDCPEKYRYRQTLGAGEPLVYFEDPKRREMTPKKDEKEEDGL
jgi:hypothetical protein